MQETKFETTLRSAGASESARLTPGNGDSAGSEAETGGSNSAAIAPHFVKKRSRRAGTGGRIAWASFAVLALTAPLSLLGAQSYTVDLDAPTIDKWQYPFGGTGATRTSASTFGAVGVAGFDDRDAQFFNAFNTAGLVPTGLGAGSYQILSATFTLSIAPGPTGFAPDLIYDNSYDPISSFNGGPDDPGRPMELFGAAFRNGFSSATISDSTPFGGADEGTRNIYATDFVAGVSINGTNRDVSNSVTNGFEAVPFAIGQVAPSDLTGGKVNEDADVVFTLNLANPDVLRYLQLSLNEGRVSFLVTSLHSASQGGPVDYPIYYTNENLLGGSPARLDLQVQVVPEPNAITHSLLGFGVFVAMWRARCGFRDEEVLP